MILLNNRGLVQNETRLEWIERHLGMKMEIQCDTTMANQLHSVEKKSSSLAIDIHVLYVMFLVNGHCLWLQSFSRRWIGLIRLRLVLPLLRRTPFFIGSFAIRLLFNMMK